MTDFQPAEEEPKDPSWWTLIKHEAVEPPDNYGGSTLLKVWMITFGVIFAFFLTLMLLVILFWTANTLLPSPSPPAPTVTPTLTR